VTYFSLRSPPFFPFAHTLFPPDLVMITASQYLPQIPLFFLGNLTLSRFHRVLCNFLAFSFIFPFSPETLGYFTPFFSLKPTPRVTFYINQSPFFTPPLFLGSVVKSHPCVFGPSLPFFFRQGFFPQKIVFFTFCLFSTSLEIIDQHNFCSTPPPNVQGHFLETHFPLVLSNRSFPRSFCNLVSFSFVSSEVYLAVFSYPTSLRYLFFANITLK